MRRITLAVAFAVTSLALSHYGLAAEAEPLLPGQYKRIHQQVFREILGGSAEQAAAHLENLLRAQPSDAESLYMLSAAYAQLGRLDEAVASMQQAIEAGLPQERWLAGTLTGLEPLRRHPAWLRLAKAFEHRLVHGPMLGCLTDRSVRFWVRTAGAAEVQAVAWRVRGDGGAAESATVRTDQNSDFTGVLQLEGLEASTSYRYSIRVNGQPHDATAEQQTFRTFSATGRPGKFRIAFGGGAGFVPPHERVWDTIRARQPDALLLLGDNVYIDDPKSPAMQHYTYYRRQSRPEFRRLVSTTPVFSIWDDHDFGTNDCQGGPGIEQPRWKRPVFQVFRHNWVNPAYGGGDQQPGCYYDFYLADIHFIMLDGRYYRDLKPSDGSRSTMLGPVQRQWLLGTIASSQGALLVLCSPVPWVFKAKGKSKDTWNGFREERDEIFRFLTEHRTDGVVLMSADRHRSDLWKIPREADYPLYELNSSRLTNQHVHGVMKEAEFSYNAKQSLGLVDFDTTLSDPTIRYRIINIDGEKVFDFVIRRSELTRPE